MYLIILCVFVVGCCRLVGSTSRCWHRGATGFRVCLAHCATGEGSYRWSRHTGRRCKSWFFLTRTPAPAPSSFTLTVTLTVTILVFPLTRTLIRNTLTVVRLTGTGSPNLLAYNDRDRALPTYGVCEPLDPENCMLPFPRSPCPRVLVRRAHSAQTLLSDCLTA
jgi:hypothetical protein